jgi:hypothetical protein
MSIKARIELLSTNSPVLVRFDISKEDLPDSVVTEVCQALQTNTICKEVILDGIGLKLDNALDIARAIGRNVIQKLDLGYNRIPAEGIVAIGRAMATNTSITELKLHRQESDYGLSAEDELVKLWLTNTTLIRLYATLHSRTCATVNTRAEVRNMEIKKRKEAGKDWMDLDPQRVEEYKLQQEELRLKKEAEFAAANAPISAKIESTGGPYTLKQLTCAKEFLADDVDVSKKEIYLSDAEFLSVFKLDKAKFEQLPKWKQTNEKNQRKLA